MNRNVTVYEVFDWLRFPLIFGVVWLHSFGKPYDFSAIDFSSLSGMDCYNLFRTCISMVLTHICVPLFFFISGYLFFTKLRQWVWCVYAQKLKRRVKTLLIPYVFWNCIYLLVQLLSELRHGGLFAVSAFFQDHNFSSLFWNCEVWNLDRTNIFGGGRIESAPILIPLWYLRDLMVVCIISPLFYFLFKRMKVFGLLLILLGYITGVGLGYWGLTCEAYMFFGLGAYCNIRMIDVTHVTYRQRWLFYLFAIVLCIITTRFNGHNSEVGDIIYPYWVLVGCIAFFNIAVSACRSNVKIPGYLTNSSFFIYLIHTIYIVTFSNHMMKIIFGTTSPILMAIGFIISPILTAFICVAIYYLLKRLMPRACSILTGDR